MNFRKKFQMPHVGFQIAPLLDILLTLLIFFMVTSVTATRETKMNLTVPTSETRGEATRNVGEVIINVDEAGHVFIRNAELTLSRLETLLAQVAKEYRDQPVIIRAAAKTRHENVIAVLDVCRKVDIWNVAFATIPVPARSAPGDK